MARLRRSAALASAKIAAFCQMHGSGSLKLFWMSMRPSYGMAMRSFPCSDDAQFLCHLFGSMLLEAMISSLQSWVQF